MVSIIEIEEWLGKKLLGRDRGEIILCLMIVAYAVVFSFFTISRHHAFKTRAWDLGIFTQSLWTTLNANQFFYHTCELSVNPSGSFFGVHFSPILLFVLPLYWIAQTPETLLVFQSFIIAFASIPIYKLGKSAGGRIVGLVFVFAYLMYPGIHFLNWYDFHVQSFLPLFFSFTIYYLRKQAWPKYLIFMFLSLMCQEHVALITFFIGIYVAWINKRSVISSLKNKDFGDKKLLIPILTMIVSVVWYLFTLWQRNAFFPTNPAALEEFLGSGNFSILGAKSPLEVPLLIILRPFNAVQALIYQSHMKLLYLALVFGPLAFFSFKAPSALIPTIPWFVFSMISQSMFHHALGTQYESYIVAFIFAAAIFAVRKNYLRENGFVIIKGSIKRIVVFSLIFFVAASPLGVVANVFFPDYTSIHKGEHEMLLAKTLNTIPPNASILTQDNLFPHVSHRIEAYVLPSRWINSTVHEIVIDFVNQTMNEVEYVLIDRQTDPVAAELILSLLESKPRLSLIISEDKGSILLYATTS